MLLFLSQAQTLRIVRAAKNGAGKTERTRVGQISKSTLVKTLNKGVSLSPDETRQLDGVIDVMKRGAEARRQSYALDFPEITRQTMEYFETATAPEREMIASAVAEAMRKIRKFEKAG